MTGFIPPMLAGTIPEDFKIKPDDANDEWVAEEKYDGHRLIAEVSEGPDPRAGLPFEPVTDQPKRTVRAWSRNGLSRILPAHIVEKLSQLPPGTYDGELLVPGKRSYGVTEIVNGPDLVYVIFDVLCLLGKDTTRLAYRTRRELLTQIREHELLHFHLGAVRLAEAWAILSQEDVNEFAEQVWSRDGEGLILKRTSAVYHPGKRSNDFLKVKAVRSAVLTVTGFIPAKLGPFAKVALRDENGVTTSVKTRNTAERNRLAANPEAFIGRSLRITYQERTPDGSYRHGRWDRFEDE